MKEDSLPNHVDDQMIRVVRGKMKKRLEIIKNRFDNYLELLMEQVGVQDVNKPLIYNGYNLKKLSVLSKYKLLQHNEIMV